LPARRKEANSTRAMRRRLDLELVRRGIVGTRTEAALAIRSGTVTVAGRPAVKASTLVDAREAIVLVRASGRFVSRGGEKLDAAVDRFGIAVSGRKAVDAGASTGGFTDCLLARGAAQVVALDVGYGQLDWRLRQDPRVIVLERKNVRELGPGDLPFRPDLVTADLSFISLRLAIPALARCAVREAEFVLLVKPQFEVGRREVGGHGVVRDPDAWRKVVEGIAAACVEHSVTPLDVMASPLVGPAGNAEFLLHGRGGEASASVEGLATRAFGEAVDTAIDEALAATSRDGHG
jgi:23S rRNA (cytidine1920-2'-O)/16S rRNA (cytidine1409-2'-O)-methyltransferase